MRDDFSRHLDAISFSGIREFFDLVLDAKDIISLGVGESDFPAPWTVREESIYALEKGCTTYTSNQGLFELRSAVGQYLAAESGVTYSPDKEILITNGVSEAADLACRVLLNPGDEVILPQPMYVCYEPLIRLTGATVVSLDTSETGFVPDPKSIEALITKKTKAIVLCYPSNPTGMSIPRNVLEEIAAIALKYDLWVISDEIYGDISYETPFVSFASLPKMQERTILLNGFSKSFAMTGFRIGYMCGSEAVVSRANKIHQYSALCASSISQYAGLEALKNGHDEKKKMKTSYRKRRNLFVAGLNEIGLNTQMPDGAFYCFSDIRSTGLSSQEFAIRLLTQEKVAVIPGHVFGSGGEGFVRSCYATDVSDLKEALLRIKKFLGGLG